MKPEVEQAVNELVRLGIVNKDEITSAFESHAEAKELEDRDALGDFLEQIGLLTAYQARVMRDKLSEDLVMDNYLIMDRLGEGGMGKVFKARHKRMRRIVAIKVLNPEIQENPDHLQRFQREVESLAKLNHPNVIQAYDADIGKFGSYLVLEFVEGSDLDRIVRKNGPLPVNQAVDSIIQSAKALQYVHDQGMVHRDIKPQNLMLDRHGNVKVADLGLVRLVDHEKSGGQEPQAGLTAEFTIAGTLEFMAPEQAEDTSKVDHRADIYSLGCSLYFILAGKDVYTGKTVIDKLIAHREKPIPSLAESRPEVPAKLQEIFCKMVAKQAAERYQKMSDVVADLESLKSSQTLSTAQSATKVIPAMASNAATAFFDAAQNTINLPKPSTAQILLIEPSKLQGMMIGSQLKSIGFDGVNLVTNAREGLEKLNAGGIAAVICAQTLPDAKGVEFAQMLRLDTKFHSLPFILITSNIDQELQESSAKLNIKILRKPFTPENLQQALALDQKPTVSPPSDTTEFLSKSVLLVDDSAFARRRMKGILNQMGYSSVVEAGNGAEGLAMAKEKPFLFIISDYHMPVMDGKGLAENIYQDPKLRKTPILLITSEPDCFQLDSVRKQENCRVLSKSVECSALEKEIASFLSNRVK